MDIGKQLVMGLEGYIAAQKLSLGTLYAKFVGETYEDKKMVFSYAIEGMAGENLRWFPVCEMEPLVYLLRNFEPRFQHGARIIEMIFQNMATMLFDEGLRRLVGMSQAEIDAALDAVNDPNFQPSEKQIRFFAVLEFLSQRD